jgi:hypothetical protein
LIRFGFLSQNSLYEIDYKLLIRNINVFSGCSQGDNPCLCVKNSVVGLYKYFKVSSSFLIN